MRARKMSVENCERLARDAKFSPKAMAAGWSVSLRQLERLFAKEFHKSPKKWARELRQRLARELLTQGWSNKEIVAELRFGSEPHFCHEFKKLSGMSPKSLLQANFAIGQAMGD